MNDEFRRSVAAEIGRVDRPTVGAGNFGGLVGQRGPASSNSSKGFGFDMPRLRLAFLVTTPQDPKRELITPFHLMSPILIGWKLQCFCFRIEHGLYQFQFL